MGGMEGAEIVDLPRLVKRRTATEPVDAAGLRPGGPDREIDLPIAVDVVRRDADVVARRLITDHRVLLPFACRLGRIAIPEDGVLRDDDDVLPGVAVDVGERYGVADLPWMGVDDARLEGRLGGGGRREPRAGEEKRHDTEPAHKRPRA